MAGSVEGGRAACETNKRKYGEDYYSRIGRVGGAKGRTGGFWHKKYIIGDDNFAREAGRIGGKISRRKKVTDE